MLAGLVLAAGAWILLTVEERRRRQALGLPPPVPFLVRLAGGEAMDTPAPAETAQSLDPAPQKAAGTHPLIWILGIGGWVVVLRYLLSHQ